MKLLKAEIKVFRPTTRLSRGRWGGRPPHRHSRTVRETLRLRSRQALLRTCFRLTQLLSIRAVVIGTAVIELRIAAA